MNNDEEKASKSVIFEALFDSQKILHDNFLNNNFRLSAVLTVVIGWLVSSEKANDFLLNTHIVIFGIFVLLAPVALILLYMNSKKAKNLSEKVHGELCSLEYMDEKYFEHHVISKQLFISMFVLIGVLLSVILFAMFTIRF